MIDVKFRAQRLCLIGIEVFTPRATYNIETDYVCQDRYLKYGYDQGRARWPEVTCTGSGSRMKFTRRLIMYAESP